MSKLTTILEGASIRDLLLKEKNIPKKNTNGDCYQAAANIVVDLDEDTDLILVHGIVTGQGPIEGVEYGHAWVEDGGMVIDKSNGRDITMPKAMYYGLGNIHKRNTIRYTREEAVKKMLDSGHYGPWDLKSEL